MLHCANPSPQSGGAALGATAGGLVHLLSPILAALFLAAGCSAPAGAEDGADLCLRDAACADASATGDASIDGQAEASASPIVASPSPLEFGQVPPGKTAERHLEVTNTGAVAVTITGFRLAGHLSFTLNGLHPDDPVGWSAASAGEGVAFREPIQLEPAGSSNVLTVTFRPREIAEASAVLTLLTDARPSELSIPLHAAVAAGGSDTGKACLSVPGGAVDFGCVATGARVERLFTVASCDAKAGEDLVLQRIQLAGQAGERFALDLGGLPRGDVGVVPSGARQVAVYDPPVIIPAGTEATFRVAYVGGAALGSPTLGAWEPDGDEVLVHALGDPAPKRVPVRGASHDPACPSPTGIAVKEGGSVEPDTLLHLRASPSFSCASAPPFYSWTVTQPAGSAGSFLPGAFSESPTFAVSHAGAYVFGLAVLDGAGHPQCAPAATTVNVGLGSNLSVVLTWKTPGDEDPTDDGPEASADLDLHFLHPAAQGFDVDKDGAPDGWFDEFYDCFWFNTDPSWGTPNPNADNGPHLKVDAPGGSQFESLAITPLTEQRKYRIGVHVWNDHAFGPSLATVRVLVGTTMAYEAKDVSLNHLDMWEVATIDWPSGVVKSVLLPGGARKILPKYDSDFFPTP
jgi:hypothetical protein